MKVKVNIINTRCILMSEVPCQVYDDDFNSFREISLVRDTHTHTYGLSSSLKFAYKFAYKNES